MIHRRGFSTLVLFIGSVCVCVCLQHLTYGASVRPENAVTYSAGNEGQNICGVFSETAPLQRYGTCSLYRYPCSRPFLLRGKRACAYLTTSSRATTRRSMRTCARKTKSSTQHLATRKSSTASQHFGMKSF